MSRNRPARALAVLVLMVAQAVFALPHRTMVGQATAQAAGAGVSHTDCHHPGDGGNASHSKTPMPPCGNCPSSMPGPTGGGCPDMGSCGPSSASPSAPPQELLAVASTTEFAPAISAPAAHDFIPDPPPPRA